MRAFFSAFVGPRDLLRCSQLLPERVRNRFRFCKLPGLDFAKLQCPQMKTFFVYIMSNKSRRIYVGSSSELQRRVFQHKSKWFERFTSRYKFDMLVYIEPHSDPNEAVARERQIKGWRREKKLRLILSANPDWADLSAEWEEDESWKSIPEAKARPVLRRRSGKS